MPHIHVTQDDILIRPAFDSNGALKGYFALSATDFGDASIQPSAGELCATPQEAIAVYADDRWPELGAIAFGRRWITTRPGGYDGSIDNLVAAISDSFPSMSHDQSYNTARRCELEWTQ